MSRVKPWPQARADRVDDRGLAHHAIQKGQIPGSPATGVGITASGRLSAAWLVLGDGAAHGSSNTLLHSNWWWFSRHEFNSRELFSPLPCQNGRDSVELSASCLRTTTCPIRSPGSTTIPHAPTSLSRRLRLHQ
jgi:hypothetical protein